MKEKLKIVLQNRLSSLYLKKSGEWTADMMEAAQFPHVTDASHFARQADPSLLDIVMTFGDRRYDIRLPAGS